MHLNDRMFETHLSTPISQTFALIAGDCNTTAWLRAWAAPAAAAHLLATWRPAMQPHVAVTGRPSTAASPVLDPGTLDVQVVRVETPADRTAAAKRAAIALDEDGSNNQQQETRSSQAAGAQESPQEPTDHLAYAWVTRAERDAQTGNWKLTCRVQVPSELSQRGCHWQRADPPIAGQEPDLTPGAARKGVGWARCKELAIGTAGQPWDQEFKGIKDGDHIICIKVRDFEGDDASSPGRRLQTQTIVLRPDQSACRSTGLATCLKGIPPPERAQAWPKRRRGQESSTASCQWSWQQKQCRVQGCDQAEILANEAIDQAEQLKQLTALSKQEGQRRAEYDRLQKEQEQKHQQMVADKARARESKQAWQQSEEKAKQAKKQLDESEQATAEVHKRAERTKITAKMEKLEEETRQLAERLRRTYD
jgi:hypothetical protein